MVESLGWEPFPGNGETPGDDELSPAAVGAVVKRRWRWVALAGLLGLLIALLYAYSRPPSYRAEATLLLQPKDPVSNLMGTRSPRVDPRLHTYARLLTGRRVLRRVARRVPSAAADSTEDTAAYVGRLQKRFTATIRRETSLVDVTFSGHDKQHARDVVGSLIRVFPTYLREQRQNILQDALRAARSIQGADDSKETSRRIQEIQTALRLSEARSQGFTAQVVSDPRVKQTGPSYAVNGAAGLILGFLLGLGVAVGREVFDRRLQSAEEVRRVTEQPVLGEVPFHEPQDAEGVPALVEGDRGSFTETLRLLRMNLLHAAGEEARSILLTSSITGEGKTTMSLNLTRAFTMVGERALLVDADMRKSRMHRLLNLPREPGLSELLRQTRKSDEVIHQLTPFSFLSAGSVPSNPPELLSSERVGQLLGRWTQKYDRVLFDGTPLLGLADMVQLAKHVDLVVLVSRYEHTPVKGLKRAIRQLEDVGASPDGVVFNGVPVNDSEYYQYYYDDDYYRENGREKEETETLQPPVG